MRPTVVTDLEGDEEECQVLFGQVLEQEEEAALLQELLIHGPSSLLPHYPFTHSLSGAPRTLPTS